MEKNKIIIFLIILALALLSRFNIEKHKKNYKKQIEILGEHESNDIEVLMNYLNKSFRIQEDSNLTYILIIILVLSVINYL